MSAQKITTRPKRPDRYSGKSLFSSYPSLGRKMLAVDLCLVELQLGRYQVLKYLLRHPANETVRHVAAARTMDPTVLYFLAQLNCKHTRLTLAARQDLPHELLEQLARDECTDVRCAAQVTQHKILTAYSPAALDEQPPGAQDR